MRTAVRKGDVYGEWTIVKESASRGKSRYVLAKCSCELEFEVGLSSLKTGKSTKCMKCAALSRRVVPVASSYGLWSTIKEVLGSSPRMILCKCACGIESTVALSDLCRGRSNSCFECAHKLRRKEDIQPGDLIGNWKILGESSKRGITRYLRAECRCGCVQDVNIDNLRCGGSQKCVECRKSVKGSQSPLWTGHGMIPGLRWNSIKAGAETRNIEFDISIEAAWELYLNQNGKCALSGISISFGKRRSGSASLDRIDSRGKYSIENVQWVHKDINRMKWAFSQEYFVEMCCNVAKNSDSEALVFL